MATERLAPLLSQKGVQLSIGRELILGDCHNSGSFPSAQVLHMCMHASGWGALSTKPKLKPPRAGSVARQGIPSPGMASLSSLSGWSSLMSVSFPKALSIPKTALKKKWLPPAPPGHSGHHFPCWAETRQPSQAWRMVPNHPFWHTLLRGTQTKSLLFSTHTPP